MGTKILIQKQVLNASISIKVSNIRPRIKYKYEISNSTHKNNKCSVPEKYLHQDPVLSIKISIQYHDKRSI